ncbi:MAG: glycosyltransferase family 2 protein [Parcubacteria group bacterium]|nr:glycosyltransferase family 2 protein [Parcubacteria group bacterium]
MTTSVIIVSYNVAEHLRRCLMSLALQTKLPDEIIVVDNASADETVSMIKREFPHVRLITNAENRGFAKAVNQAMRISRGEALLILNPDTEVPPTTLDALGSYLAQHTDVGIVGPKIIKPDGSLELGARKTLPTPNVAFFRMIGLARLFPRHKTFARYNLTYLDPDGIYPVDIVSGSCMLVRRVVAEKLSGFDERFFMYAEDIDFCYRAGQAGYNVHYVGAVTITHVHGASSRKRRLQSIFHFYRSMWLFYNKHFAAGTFVLLRPFVYAAILLRGTLAFLWNGLLRRPGHFA